MVASLPCSKTLVAGFAGNPWPLWQSFWATLGPCGSHFEGAPTNKLPFTSQNLKIGPNQACALVPNPFIPSFVALSSKHGHVYAWTVEFAWAPPLLLLRMPSIPRSSLRALTSLSQLRCDKKLIASRLWQTGLVLINTVKGSQTSYKKNVRFDGGSRRKFF